LYLNFCNAKIAGEEYNVLCKHLITINDLVHG
jgi:hypothetical protein